MLGLVNEQLFSNNNGMLINNESETRKKTVIRLRFVFKLSQQLEDTVDGKLASC